MEKYKPSKPFSNGTEYEVFNELRCCNCKHYVDWEKGKPCPIEDAISKAYIDPKFFPKKEIVDEYDDNGKCVDKYICLKFEKEKGGNTSE